MRWRCPLIWLSLIVLTWAVFLQVRHFEFVNLDDNAFLDDQQFTVFGEVADRMTIIDAMSEVETESANIEDGGTIPDVPVNDITIVSFRRVP